MRKLKTELPEGFDTGMAYEYLDGRTEEEYLVLYHWTTRKVGFFRKRMKTGWFEVARRPVAHVWGGPEIALHTLIGYAEQIEREQR